MKILAKKLTNKAPIFINAADFALAHVIYPPRQ